MFKLNDPLDDRVTINGEEHPIYMAFDNVMNALEAFDDQELSEADRLYVFLGTMLHDYGGDLLDTLDFETQVDIGKQIIEQINSEPIENQPVDLEGNPMPQPKRDGEQLVSFLFDAKYIYAAFMQAYGIDLIEQQGSLHWSKFSALLNALPDNTLMRQIIDIRKTNLNEIKDKNERKRIRKLQQQFSLENKADSNEEGGDTYG
ncbi:bacteriophage Gp15 family protein [Latilactobacillus curvatus]|uniref:Gp15 family bacteriophage protein n=1 Tax=Latilactobacillus curvatus TaxID=28038 RepID=UPI0020736950|nr:Gp15 family bacteriophage protein [Latilactobacillus curvatus]MCM6843414.1 bacteriophage Gp15 family protein [Latilactobacillus curvatus]MCM6861734.1 bacteriophage Gp15 family protein [Latilactobacillus curvatus]MCM6869001.1 bacteriophage Gp15 family protein [Latilactobacillus curvatus]